LRSCKSEAEIECLRRAAAITLAGYREGFQSLKEGMTEKELAAVIVSKWLALGADGIAFLGIASAPDGARYAHVGPGDRSIRKGEVVNIDGGCMVRGYCADLFRMACLGEPNNRDEKRLIRCIIEAKDAMIGAIRPGALVHEPFDAAEKVIQKGGFGHLVPDTTWGHGLGLDIHELPTLTKGSLSEIEENMVFCVEPWTMDYSDWSMARNFEDAVRVTPSGAELLSPGLNDLVIL